MRRAVPFALAALLLGPAPGHAALSRAALATVAAAPRAGAAVPADLPFVGPGGEATTIGAALGGRPAVLMLADFRCTQLCGSMLAIAARALSAGGLVAGRDFSLVVVGFNPDAGADDAARLAGEALGAYPDLGARARLLTGGPGAVGRLEAALGFTALRDADGGRFAHPADLYVLTAEGRVSRVLDGLALDPTTLRLALVEAGQGRIGSVIDRLHLLCYGLEPLSGASTGLAQAMLRVGAGGLLAGAGVLAAIRLRRRRVQPGGARP